MKTLLILAALFPSANGTVEEGKDPPAADLGHGPAECGIEALYLLMRLRGRSIAIEDLKRALPPPRPDGYSMADLQRASRRLGLWLEGRWLGRDDFPLSTPVIAYVRHGAHGHFITLRPVGDRGAMVQIADPPHSPQVIDGDQLIRSSLWTGMALVPSTKIKYFLEHNSIFVFFAVSSIAIIFFMFIYKKIVSRIAPRIGVPPARPTHRASVS